MPSAPSRLAAHLAACLLLAAACGDPPLQSHDRYADDAASTSGSGGGEVAVSTGGPDSSNTTTGQPDASATTTGQTTGSDVAVAEDAPLPPADQGENPCVCDDGDPCTKDQCDDAGVCGHTLYKAPECAPTVVITAPERASTAWAAPQVAVAGKFTAPAGLSTLTLNGTPLTPTGSLFAADVEPVHGINVLAAELIDLAGAKARTVQAFLMGQAFYPTTNGDTPEASVYNGMVVYLGGAVWDDVAQLITTVVEGIDLSELLNKGFLAEGEGPGLLWCEWAIVINSIDFDVQSLSLVPVKDGLAMTVVLKDVTIDFAATDPGFLCIDLVGTAVSEEVVITTVLHITVDDIGDVIVSADEVAVDIAPPKVDFTKGFASLFDWFVNLFDSVVANVLENQIEGLIVDQIGPLIAGVIESFGQDGVPFDVPSLAGLTAPITVTLGLKPAWIDIDQSGARLGLSARVTAPKGTKSISSPGSLARNGCLHDDPKAFIIPTDAPMTMALHDDLLNQVLFAAWWGGAIHVTIPNEVLQGFLTNFEIDLTDISLLIDPHLPPVISSCPGGKLLELHLGDLRAVLDAKLGGEPANAELWLSAKVQVEPQISTGEDGAAKLGLGLVGVPVFDYEVIGAGGIFEGAEAALDAILGSVVKSLLEDQIAGGLIPSFPIPSIDLGGIVPGLPMGTTLTIAPSKLGHTGAYTVLQGTVGQ